MHCMYTAAFSIFVVAVTFINGTLAQTLTLHCVQHEQEQGCKALYDATPNQWTFALEKESGRVFRCAGRDCGPPFDVLVRWGVTGEVHFWEPVANEAFAISADRRAFSRSGITARGSGGHVVAEFGYCMPPR